MCNCLLLSNLSPKQLWFLHPVRCNFSANLGKAVLTFSAERLITESTKEWHIFSDEVQELWTMAVLSHCINPPDSAVTANLLHKSRFFLHDWSLCHHDYHNRSRCCVIFNILLLYQVRRQMDTSVTLVLYCLLKTRNLVYYYNKISQWTIFLANWASMNCRTEMW